MIEEGGAVGSLKRKKKRKEKKRRAFQNATSDGMMFDTSSAFCNINSVRKKNGRE